MAEDATTSERSALRAWLSGRLPAAWFTGEPEVTVDRDEITIVGTVAAPEIEGDDLARREAETGRIQRFREETRDERISIARALEHRSGRHVAWGVTVGASREMFTNLSVPTMTRLRQPERVVLDTLVEAGVARSRSDALGWCVRLVAEHSEQWLSDLRTALGDVERLRAAGPTGPAA
jgi:hypothetical protein